MTTASALETPLPKKTPQVDLDRTRERLIRLGLVHAADRLGEHVATAAKETDAPHRFRTKRQFWSYCGLGVVTRSSSDWVQTVDGAWIKSRVPQTRGLSRQRNHFLKEIFKGAATTVVTQRNKDPIHARYERLLDGGTKPSLAKLSLARMIAATVLRMWKDEEEYDPGRAGLPAKTREGWTFARSGESARRQSLEYASAKCVRRPRIARQRR
jgi:hypothetical protein